MKKLTDESSESREIGKKSRSKPVISFVKFECITGFLLLMGSKEHYGIN